MWQWARINFIVEKTGNESSASPIKIFVKIRSNHKKMRVFSTSWHKKNLWGTQRNSGKNSKGMFFPYSAICFFRYVFHYQLPKTLGRFEYFQWSSNDLLTYHCFIFCTNKKLGVPLKERGQCKDYYVWTGIGNNTCNDIQNGQTEWAPTISSHDVPKAMSGNEYENGTNIKWTGLGSKYWFAFALYLNLSSWEY